MAAYGFNCIRYPWYDATLPANLKVADQIVEAAKAVGMKVILDHHGDEAPSKDNAYLPFPCNGLPFDTGPGTNGTDGSGPTGCVTKGEKGTVSRAKYVADWVTVAQHYAGNATVIGFDLTNEPHLNPSWYSANPGGATWGTGAATDLQAIYREVGNAIQKVNPGPLIIAEGILNWTDTLLDGKANTLTGYPDLTLAGTKPVVLSIANKLVYSIHDYPYTISAVTPDSGNAKVAAMNGGWGYLVSNHIAPVWIGEMGASLDGVGPDSKGGAHLSDEQKWADMMVAYVNGEDGASGGPTFAGCETGIGTDWWAWGNLAGESPDGTLDDTGKPRAQQKAITRKLQFVKAKGC